MNCETGQIGTQEALLAVGSKLEDMVQIDMTDATPKQTEESKVSLHDTRSKLGLILTARRRKVRDKNKSARQNRRKQNRKRRSK